MKMELSLDLKMFCLVLCFGYVLSTSSEKAAQDIIDHILRIPNTDKVLNSVLGRLESNRQRQAEEEDCDDPTEILPEYTDALRESREIGVRQFGAAKHYPICHMERKILRLNTNEYEYRPAYYEEIKCVHAAEESGGTSEICSSLGFSCVQWNKTIHLTRRRYASDCWETKTMVIPAGCECMWPVHKLGEMKFHI